MNRRTKSNRSHRSNRSLWHARSFWHARSPWHVCVVATSGWIVLLLLSWVMSSSVESSPRTTVALSPGGLNAPLLHLTDDPELLERGREIYAASCADCHGGQGEGVAGAYPMALTGDDSIGQLTGVIADTMPEGAPEDCVGEEAQAVAAYIHHAFYSEAAQVRNRPPRIGLARLTANQLRQSYADLYASQSGGVIWAKPERGVQGIYFNTDHWKEEEKKFERVDPGIDFDFGREGPGSDIQAGKYYVHWSGGLKVDHSGEYEIVVRCSSSFMMHFGRDGRVFFDNHVQSGDQVEFRQSIYLTAGRVYPFKLELRQRERTTEAPPVHVKLAWVAPGGVEEPIPTANLVPGWMPPTFALQTPLPPDDQSYGYERGIQVNAQWDQATTSAAVEFADIANSELWPEFRREYIKRHPDRSESREALRDFLARIVQRAFRFPIDEADRKRYIDRHLETNPDDALAIKQTLLLALKSPYFLYPAAADFQASASRQTANRLALVLMDSLPMDDALDKLATQEQVSDDDIRGYVWSKWNDFRVQAKYRSLLYQWLHLNPHREIHKNPETFPGFDSQVVQDLRQSFDLTLSEMLVDSKSDFRKLLTQERFYTTETLRQYYGDEWAPAEEAAAVGRFRLSVASPQPRGVLSHPLVTSQFAYHNSTSPIHRGVMMYRFVLGRNLRPPTDDFSPLSPDLHPDLTTRQRVELQTSPESCQVCHIKINNLGFTLENYDATGKFRSLEQERTIDPSGSYTDRDGQEHKLGGFDALAEYLVDSPDLHRAFVNRVFQHFTKQPAAAYGPEVLDRLTEGFVSSGCNLPTLLVEIAVIAARVVDRSVDPE